MDLPSRSMAEIAPRHRSGTALKLLWQFLASVLFVGTYYLRDVLFAGTYYLRGRMDIGSR